MSLLSLRVENGHDPSSDQVCLLLQVLEAIAWIAWRLTRNGCTYRIRMELLWWRPAAEDPHRATYKENVKIRNAGFQDQEQSCALSFPLRMEGKAGKITMSE